jgi:hypothetical protein
VGVIGLGDVVFKSCAACAVADDPAGLTMVVVAEAIDSVTYDRFSARPGTVVEMMVPGIPLHVPHTSSGDRPETPGVRLVGTEMAIPLTGVVQSSMDEKHIDRAREGGSGKRNDREADEKDPYERSYRRSPDDFAQPRGALRLRSTFC